MHFSIEESCYFVWFKQEFTGNDFDKEERANEEESVTLITKLSLSLFVEQNELSLKGQ